MLSSVKSAMDSAVFSVRATDTAESAMRRMLAARHYRAAVIDGAGRPLGILSLSDLITRRGTQVANRMSSPALVVREDARVADAAILLAQTGYHQLIVVDESNRVVGMISLLEVTRALVGVPVRHPAACPGFAHNGIPWSPDSILNPQGASNVPDAPGLLLLISAEGVTAGGPALAVWAECASNLRARLVELLAIPQGNPELSSLLASSSPLHFRVATLTSARRLPRPMVQ